MSDQVFIYTMNQGGGRGRWSRYVFPFVIEKFGHLRDSLYLRHGDNVSKVVEGALTDGAVDTNDIFVLPTGDRLLLPDGISRLLLLTVADKEFDAIIQWPWLDFGKPGVNKMMEGFDIAGIGTASVEFGYDQSNLQSFTQKYPITPDSVPGQIVSMPLNAPSISVKLTYDGGQAWEWSAFQVLIQDQREIA